METTMIKKICQLQSWDIYQNFISFSDFLSLPTEIWNILYTHKNFISIVHTLWEGGCMYPMHKIPSLTSDPIKRILYRSNKWSNMLQALSAYDSLFSFINISMLNLTNKRTDLNCLGSWLNVATDNLQK